MTSNNRRASSRPRLLVGSSMTSTRAPVASARAISTICCWRPRVIRRARRAEGRVGRAVERRGRDPRRIPGQRTRPCSRWLVAEDDVLHHGEIRRERQLLIDHGDAGTFARRADSSDERCTVDEHATRRPGVARRPGSTSACSCRRRSGRRARRPHRGALKNPRRRPRSSRQMPCGLPASRSGGVLLPQPFLRDRAGAAP